MRRNSGTDVEREDRYAVVGGQAVLLSVEPDNLRQQRQMLRGELLDLSPHGARLSVSADLSISKALRLEFSIISLCLEFYVSADVCWSKRIDEDEWHIGCALNPGMPTGVLDQLVRNGRLNRRCTLRHEGRLELRGHAELADRGEPVTLQNYSQGGFCVSASQLGKPGERIHIFVEEPKERLIVATVQWRLKVRDSYLLGCAFLNEKDFAYLRDACELTGSVQV